MVPDIGSDMSRSTKSMRRNYQAKAEAGLKPVVAYLDEDQRKFVDAVKVQRALGSRDRALAWILNSAMEGGASTSTDTPK